LFFFLKNKMLLHTCALDEAQKYGDFLNYPYSHDRVWMKLYRKRYNVDFDYYPRGRIIYNISMDRYTLFYDGCIEDEAKRLANAYVGAEIVLTRDEHYQCHKCNNEYVDVKY